MNVTARFPVLQWAFALAVTPVTVALGEVVIVSGHIPRRTQWTNQRDRTNFLVGGVTGISGRMLGSRSGCCDSGIYGIGTGGSQC